MTEDNAMAERQLAVIQQTGEIVPVSDWDDTRREFIRKNFCGGAPDAIAATFLGLCERRRLSPEARHVYLVNRAGKDKNGNPKPPNWVIQTGIDGYRLIADRTGRYVGSDDPVFEYNAERTKIVRATVTVRKLVGGVTGAFTASARMDEYAAGSDLWMKMPHTMIAKCAEGLALRKAFPEELSGVYTDVEMDQAETPVTVHSARPVPAHPHAIDVPDEERWEGGCTKKQLQRLNIIRQQKGVTADGLKKMHGKTSGKLLTEAEAADLIAQISTYPDIVIDEPDDDADQTGMFDNSDPDRFTR